jgi:hypothetical protein
LVDLFPLFQAFHLLLQLLDKDFVLFLVILNVSADAFNFSLVGLDIELQLIQLLILVVGNIVEDFTLELLKCFLDIFRCDFLGER